MAAKKSPWSKNRKATQEVNRAKSEIRKKARHASQMEREATNRKSRVNGFLTPWETAKNLRALRRRGKAA